MSEFDDYDADDERPTKGPRHATRVPDEVGMDIHHRLAAHMARSKANRHECTAPRTGTCEHPNHRRDADSLLSTDARFPGILEMLDLSTELCPVTDAERRTYLKWIGQSGPVEDDLAA